MPSRIDRAQRKITVAVVGSYFLKTSSKLITGTLFSIPPLVADGLHGIIDIFEHGALVIAGHHARKADREKYPIDRQPLIELLGLGIFMGLFLLGLNFLLDAFKTLTVLLVNAEWVNLGWLPFSVDNILEKISIPKGNSLRIAAIILFACYIISEIVYRFQFRLASEHCLREMEADAMELRSDGWIEWAMASGFIAGWLITMIYTGEADSIITNNLTIIITQIILLALSLYLIKISIPEIYEKYQNLMNVALDRKKREQLEKAIERRIPGSCSLVSPLTAYHRGEQLYVTGRVGIDRSIMRSADLIISRAEQVAKRFLSDLNRDIRVQFSPFFIWDSDSIKRDLNEVIQSAWKVLPESPAAKAFFLLRTGNLSDAKSVLDSSPLEDIESTALAEYVRAEIALRMEDPAFSKRDLIVQDLDTLLSRDDLSLSAKVMLSSWLLIYETDRKDGDAFISHARARINKFLAAVGHVPEIAQAEACFALGFSWERCKNYDIQKAVNFYRQSEASYARSGVRSESDRLMNTWGHLETRLYVMGDAEDHLEIAHEIRKLRGDPLSLSFTYGCLGDLHARLGNYDYADDYYAKDIEVLNRLDIRHMTSGVMCKQGETRIKSGLVNNKPNVISEGISLCEKAEKLAGDGNKNALFFALKGQLKGWLGLASTTDDKAARGNYLDRCSGTLNNLDSQNTYQKAFSLRLKGRYLAQSGDVKGAVKAFDEAAGYFDSMREPISETGLSLQTTGCRIEILRYTLENQEPAENIDTHAIEALEAFLDSMGGMLGNLGSNLRDIIADVRGGMEGKTLNYRDIMTKLDNLTWLMEE